MTQVAEKTVAPLLVTIEGMNGSLDVEMPGDIAIRNLLPLLIQHPIIARGSDPQDASHWTLGLKGGQRFEQTNSLYNYGVLEGSVLLLQPSAQWSNPLPEVEEELVLPNENKLLIIQNINSSLSSIFKKFRGKN